ncbi:MAG TPA: hypothetical protein VKR60_06395 [Candidatus Sulfotelmatobacter sp.]|nr:hypothetical protein [Candidatus Sulfotelmatobacter sp.]
MTSSAPAPDLAAQWEAARRLYPIYSELAREFVIDVQPCADLESGAATPGRESVEQANHWLDEMDQRVQVHQLRQFLQTNPLGDQDGLLRLLQHFLTTPTRTDATRDKIDFLLVQYFSTTAPGKLEDSDVDLAFVAQYLEPVLGSVELKTPLWLNALDRVLDGARKCKNLDQLLHGGILEQGRKAKTQAGDLFYLPIALVAFTRFGYLMRRAFFRLMHNDLNAILDGLDELETKHIEAIDCRRAQFSAQEPVARLRIICQSWKVMFQAEYSSGSPLRMLVDLRASVDYALGRGKAPEAEKKSPAPAGAIAGKPAPAKAPAVPAKAAPAAVAGGVKAASSPTNTGPVAAKAAAAKAAGGAPTSAVSSAAGKPAAANATAPGKFAAIAKPAGTVLKPAAPAAKPEAKFSAASDDAPEFEVSAEQDWDTDSGSKPSKK